MPTSGNVGFQAPQLTPPPQANVQVETYADEAKQNQQQAQMPPVYYGGKTGSVAFMADKVLTGWLAGTKMAQERKAKKMADEVGAAKTGLDYIGQAYRAAVESGDQKKIAETKSALSEAYNDYLNKAEQYAIPEDSGKKKGAGTKIKEGLKRFAQGGENPHLDIAKSTLDIMRKTDPTQLYGPSKQEQQQSQLTDLELKNEMNKSKLSDFSIEEQTAIKAARDEYQKAVVSGDKTAQDKAAENLKIWGVNIQSSTERQVKESVNQAALKGMSDLSSGKFTSIDQLPDLERGAMVSLGIAPQAKNAMQAYLQQVGPGKRFRTDYDAAHQYMLDERTSRVMGMKPTPLEELRASQRVILTHELQNPDTAKKYGLKEALKPGQQPPQWLIEEQAEKRYKESAEEKTDTKLYSDIAVNRINKQALAGFSPLEQEEIKRRFLMQDEGTGMLVFNPDPNVQGMDPAAARTLYNSFRNRASNLAREMYPGLTQDTLDKRFGAVPPTLQDIKPVRDSFGPPPWQKTPTHAPDRGFSQPPGYPVPQELQSPPAISKYKISKGGVSLYGGRSTTLSAEAVKAATEAGYTLEQTQ